MTPRAVYTALLGGYERLQEQPLAARSPIPFICFTDDPDLRSECWEIRLVRPQFELDSVRSARSLKLLGHESLDADESLWIDNRVRLTAEPDRILDTWLADSDVALFEHSFRETLADEFAAVVEGGFDDPTRVWEQMLHYGETVPDALEGRPVWTGIIARRRTPAVTALMMDWWAHVLRYSRRDQLSATVILRDAQRVRVMPSSSNHASAVHEWPPITPELGRRSTVRAVRFADSLRPPSARIRALEATNADLLGKLERVRRERDEARLRPEAPPEERPAGE